jgi:hypothetical protein
MADNRRNPRNNRSELFKSLTKLFSGPLVNYRSQTGRRLRRYQLDKYGSSFRSASGQQFKKSHFNPFKNMQNGIMMSHNRADRYVDHDQMEYMPEIASALDIYADEMTTSSALQPMLKIDCSNEEIRAVLESLFKNILNLEFNLFGWSRTMCKYGDFFLYLDIDEKTGIKHVIGLPTHEVERLEGEDESNPNYVQFQWNSAGMTFENWQIAHFRILGNDRYAPYGTSILEPARRIWRQLVLLEDAMMAYRIVRSPERRVFYVDVGSIPPNDVEQYMQKVMTQMKRNSIVDDNTGQVDLRYNPLSVEEDYFIPVRGETSSRVESLPGGSFTGDIDDVKYLRDKLFAALKIPASYLSRGEGSDEDKTTLAQKDIRFARTIQRLQRAIISELEKVGIIHLHTLGFRGDDLLSFKLQLNNPSKIAELQELEHWRVKFEVAAGATEGFFSRRWVAQRLFNMSDEEFLRNQRELYYDRKFDADLAATAEATAEKASMDAMSGGSLSAPPSPAPEEAGDLAAPEGPPEEEAPPEEGADDMLLAAPPDEEAPARRDVYSDGSYLTPGAKGKRYNPVTIDQRPSGANRRHYNGQWGAEMAGASTRNLFKGYNELSGLYEENDSSYSDEREERKLLESGYEIKKLIEGLEKVKNNEN